MFRRSETLLAALVVVLLSAAGVGAQHESIIPTLTPVGSSRKPVLLNQRVPFIAPTYRSTSPNEIIAQLPGLPVTNWIPFREFMEKVEEANLTLTAQRYNVPIAGAQLTAASVYPNPTFEWEYGGDVSGNGQNSTYAGSLSQTVVLGGKIGASEEVASATLRASNALLSDYLRTLRGRAADAFIDGLIGVLKLDLQAKALGRSRQLLELNAERLHKREISEDGLMRAKIAELEIQSDLFDSQSALHQKLGELAVFMGASRSHGLIAPVGNVEGSAKTFSLQELVEKAVTSRGDVIAAEEALERAQAGYRLAKVNRIPDVTISGSFAHLTQVRNPIDPSPAWNGAAVSFSVPIPLSNLNSGTVQVAYYEELQAEKSLQATKLQAENDVRMAYDHYALSVAEAQPFTSELLGDADHVYKSRVLNLEKGLVTLLDVLDAQRAFDQLYLDYYGALNRRAKALVGLEQAAGIWEIDF